MNELERVARLAPEASADDAYSTAARTKALARLRATSAPRGSRRRLRLVLLAGTAVLAVLALVLFTRLDGQESAVARARAALALPRTGILVIDSHSSFSIKSRRLTAHFEAWQDLAHPANQRTLQTDPLRGSLVERSQLHGLHMRYVRSQDAVYTQRVIVSPNAAVDATAEQSIQGAIGQIRRLLGSGHMRTGGDLERGGRRYRRLSYRYGSTSCDYLVDESSFRPAQLDCTTSSAGGGGSSRDVATFRVVPATAGARLLDLRAAYPDARVAQDPAGIPGRAGDRLADVTQPTRYVSAASDPVLRATTDAALRAVKQIEARARRAQTGCLVHHGVPQSHGGYDDPIGTVIAICQHLQDDFIAITRTAAGDELRRRNLAAITAAQACVRKAAHATDAIRRRCAIATRDPIAGGQLVPAKR
ncbi:MAG TPA: hypothetical protein VGF46_01965 [Gaiellales bacterium]